MEEPGREHRNHDKHTFHLPNIFSRATQISKNQYRTVPAGEGEEDEGEEETDAYSDSDEGALAGIGVESSPEWATMSSIQHSMIRVAFGIFGAAVLLPFNALITSSEYYRSLVADSPKENSIMSWIIAVYCVSSILFGAHATTSMQRASVGRRFILSAALIISALLLTTVLVSVVKRPTTGEPSSTAFPLVLALALILSAGTSYLQLAVVTLANAYGPTCMGTMLAGQGVVGASVSLVQLIAALSASTQSTSSSAVGGESESRKAAIQFFGTNTAFMMAGLTTFLVLQRSLLYSNMKGRMENAKQNLAEVIAQETSRTEHAARNNLASVSGIKRYLSLQSQQQISRIASTQKRVLMASFSIAYIFTVTLAIFPALTARVQSTNNSLSTIVFVALHFFVFNIGDLIGRIMPSLSSRFFLLRNTKTITTLCLLRTAFIPLVAYCNVSSSSSPSSPPSTSGLFNDPIFFMLMALLGISNGLLATSIFVVGPRQDNLTDANDQSLAVGLLSWWLTFGLATGSLFSFIVAAMY
ncbi:hypothetical protein CBS101457_004170 [Exobasidium rhododendri]|nr:hypothetical protein CBS101457_004170 [Exobasidium rhododendri]